MSNLFKKALGVFVDFSEDDEKKAAAVKAAAEAADDDDAAPADGPAPLADAPVDLSQDPDVARVMQAGQLLASLPLSDIPVDKARELVARTLEFAGMKTEELLGSFSRARELYRAAIQVEQAKVADRERQHHERMQLLEAALAEEKKQFEAEVAARNLRVEAANQGLGDIEQALAFFAPEDDEQK